MHLIDGQLTVMSGARETGDINSRFIRRCTARGSSTGLYRIGSAKVKASKSLKAPLKSEKIKHLFDIKTVAKLVTGCLKT